MLEHVNFSTRDKGMEVAFIRTKSCENFHHFSVKQYIMDKKTSTLLRRKKEEVQVPGISLPGITTKRSKNSAMIQKTYYSLPETYIYYL